MPQWQNACMNATAAATKCNQQQRQKMHILNTTEVSHPKSITTQTLTKVKQKARLYQI